MKAREVFLLLSIIALITAKMNKRGTWYNKNIRTAFRAKIRQCQDGGMFELFAVWVIVSAGYIAYGGLDD